MNEDDQHVQKIVRRNLKLYNYKITHDCFLNDVMKAKRLYSAVTPTDGGCFSKVFFIDDKTFTIELLHNCQNRWQQLKRVQQNTTAAKIIGRSHFLASAMVLAEIYATGKTSLFFIKQNMPHTGAEGGSEFRPNFIHRLPFSKSRYWAFG